MRTPREGLYNLDIPQGMQARAQTDNILTHKETLQPIDSTSQVAGWVKNAFFCIESPIPSPVNAHHGVFSNFLCLGVLDLLNKIFKQK